MPEEEKLLKSEEEAVEHGERWDFLILSFADLLITGPERSHVERAARSAVSLCMEEETVSNPFFL